MRRYAVQILGRPPTTTHADIEAVAFALFERKGFDATTTEDIAVAAGIGRRTVFRYFPSKNDIPWGQFDASLEFLRRTLESTPQEAPVWEAVQRGVTTFNTFDPAAIPQHRQRMKLLLRTPSLQAHSALMYERWRAVISSFVAHRTGQAPGDLQPRLAGHVSLALALTAYEVWLTDETTSLTDLLDAALASLRDYLIRDPAHAH